MRRLLVVLGLFLSVASAQPQSDSGLVISTTSRLVQVDIVVTGNDGKPIRDLKASDFTLYQDGKPQKLSFFDAHAGSTPAPNQATPEALPANVFSNQPKDATSPSWSILLLDLLNTPTHDQMAAREQLIKVIHSLPGGHPVALFTLTDQLTLVQGFSSQPEALLNAFNKLKIMPSKLYTTEAQRQREVGHAVEVVKMSAPSLAGSNGDNVAALGDARGGHGLKNASRSLQGYNQMEAIRTEERVIFTLDALSAISRAISGYPGRKNLLWLSGGFPIRIGPQYGGIDPWRNEKDFDESLTMASALLADSRVAVYPVDIRGAQARGVDNSVSTTASSAFTGVIAGDAQNTVSTDGYSNLLALQAAGHFDENATMFEVAKETGGRAFVNSNDLGDSILRSISDGTSYYTVAFAPPKTDEKPAYHSIDVKLNRPDTKLSYRRGYYSATHIVESPKVGAAALQGALQPGMPPSTTLLFTVKVLPPGPGRKLTVLQYSIDPSHLKFTDDHEGVRHVTVDCMSIAFDSKGKPVAQISDTMEGTIKTAHFNEVVQKGLPATQELNLPPGTYYLKTGIMDRNSSQIGTLDIPLVVPVTFN